MGTLLGRWALLASLAGVPSQGEGAHVVRIEELGLTLALPELEAFTDSGKNDWSGRLGASRVEITLRTLPESEFHCSEPEDALDLGPSHWTDPRHARNEPGVREALEGPFGYANYAVRERSVLRARDGDAVVGVRLLLGGLLPEAGYWITIEASPPPTPEDEKALDTFLAHGVVYAGKLRDPRWSDDEARARWESDAPPELRGELKAPIRTAHYLVLTNSSGGKSFAAKMEQCYAAIRKVYPFPEVAGRRLLPVFLFRTDEQYFEFFANMARISLEEARRSKGHAWRDYYATWYDAPGDPVHIHEATHQIFSNRLGLGGGGSWFQEGVAEYMSSKPGDRSAVAGLVKKGKHVPLGEFVAIRSLLLSSDRDAPGGDVAGQNYAQAALLIEFLRESPWGREKFPAFLTRVGHAGGDRASIEAAIEDVYDVDLAGLEERWVEYCKKR